MKYELIKTNKLLPNGKPAFKVKRLLDGLLGGYVEGEHNLSQDGECFIHEKARVYGNAQVYGNAELYGNAQVYEKARVGGNARVYGNAQVYRNAKIYGCAWVFDKARVGGNARVFGNAWVYEKARVYGKARVYEGVELYGNAQVSKTPINVATGLRHPITVTETHIFIGCEGHTKEYWEENIWKIGKKHKYTEDEIIKTIGILSWAVA